MNSDTPKSTHHDAVVKLLEEYDINPAKYDEIMSAQFIFDNKNRTFRRVCQFIFLTVLRNKLLIDGVMASLWKKEPSVKLRAILQAACAEIIEDNEDKHAKIVHDWVDYAKKSCSLQESKFVNALLRKFYDKASSIEKNPVSAEDISMAYSHPLWLVKKWMQEFGKQQTLDILKNNQKHSEVFFRIADTPQAAELFGNYGEYFTPTQNPRFFKLKSGNWDRIEPLLETPWIYIQDPSTFDAPNFLNPQAGEKILDLCAAPGGKSRTLADLVLENSSHAEELKQSLLVSVDFSERRMQTLRSNLQKISHIKTAAVECDILNGNLEEALEKENLPALYDAVLLDAPCSNTGVLRRRPDARYRIKSEDVSNCAAIQLKMMDKAAKFLKPGGRFVYSTCSIENEENSDNADKFIKQRPEFKLINAKVNIPSENNDGSAAFLFVKAE